MYLVSLKIIDNHCIDKHASEYILTLTISEVQKDKAPLMRVRFLFISLIVIGICICVFVVVASHLVVHPVNFKVPDYELPAEVSFGVEIISVDPIARTFTMDWYPQAPSTCPSHDDNITRVIDVYLDQGIIDSSSSAFSILPPYSPIYRFNITALCKAQTSIFNSFRTVTKLVNSHFIFGYWQGPLHSTIQNYPFDVYYAAFNMYGLDLSTGEYVTLNVTRSFGEVVNFQISLYRSNAVITPWLFYSLEVKRSRATKIFVIIVGITNWLIAVAFMLISVSTLIYQSHKIYSEMFVVPVGAVFAFTTIRAGFPGAPSGFGATIDLFTILPVLIIMSLCSFFLLLVVLYRRIGAYGQDENGKRGTLLFTGATASLRGNAVTSAFASGKFGTRALSQSLAKEFGKQNIHVAHAIIDGSILTDQSKNCGPEWEKNEDVRLNADSIASSYLYLVNQDRSAWTWELDLRPAHEKW
ncbi:hypothetical protein BDQ17DRAFT_1542485 [Cyathus striatus]|nr:hypothetical protein BDQ17DRAFT_1542485 [Cyathus striatus]